MEQRSLVASASTSWAKSVAAAAEIVGDVLVLESSRPGRRPGGTVFERVAKPRAMVDCCVMRCNCVMRRVDVVGNKEREGSLCCCKVYASENKS